MTGRQKSYLLKLIHSVAIGDRKKKLSSEIRHFGLPEDEIQKEIMNIENAFSSGIGSLNKNQLNNILEQVRQNGLISHDIRKKLEFYEVNKGSYDNIIEFLQNYMQADEPIDVGELDAGFNGVQVASRDDFNMIINQGWTGDWDLNPDNISPRRVQVASMNDDGLFPRGCYINADIIDIQPVQYPDKLRYRLFISNPIIINTGNRNVKFIAQPVRYIR